MSDQQAEAKPQHNIRKQLISSAHNNTPCTVYAGGGLFLNAIKMRASNHTNVHR